MSDTTPEQQGKEKPQNEKEKTKWDSVFTSAKKPITIFILGLPVAILITLIEIKYAVSIIGLLDKEKYSYFNDSILLFQAFIILMESLIIIAFVSQVQNVV